jgi:hypothetical protein
LVLASKMAGLTLTYLYALRKEWLLISKYKIRFRQ